MHVKRYAALCVLSCAAIAAAQGPQHTPPPLVPIGPDRLQQTQQPPTASGKIKAKTRLITIDVVVTDSHGAPIRGLKKEDFQIFEEHNRPQDIAQFEFIDHTAGAAPNPAMAPSPTRFSNDLTVDRSVAPTVLLMDALNTDVNNQMVVRQHMLSLLKTLPSTTPIAVMSLSHVLHIVQSFSTDPKILRAAIDRSMRTVPIEENPEDDANSASNQALDFNGGQETQAVQALQQFEAMEYEAQMSIRVDETADAMLQIAKYLAGYTGRKNLIWFSEAFPNWIAPNPDLSGGPFGDAFAGTASYNDKIKKAAEALTDARVAVYPVDAKGLAVDQLYSTAQDPHINQQNPGAGFAAQINRQNGQHIDAQATMDAISESTGGHTCKNTNDLSGCVQSALNDGRTYYEISYYPVGIAWDEQFHKITVKTTAHGAKLAYRRGYFANDTGKLASREDPGDMLKDACRDPLPSTGISLAVEPIQVGTGGTSQPGQTRYLLTISPNTLSFEPQDGQRHVSLQMAICEFDPAGNSFQFFPRDLSRPVPDELYKVWTDHGFRNIFDYGAKPEDKRVRFAVLDVPSGEVGSVDVPAHPTLFASVPGGVVSGTPGTQAAAGPPPASATPPATRSVVTKLKFTAANGSVSSLDWQGQSLVYTGNLGVGDGARAFFKGMFNTRFHCDAGNLVSDDTASSAKPSFQFAFRTATGGVALVDLSGEAPAYSGTLPVDGSARPFFDYLWKLCHCQEP